MNISEMRFYIASPFFSPDQLLLVQGIERCLSSLDIDYISPRKYGVVSEISEQCREIRLKQIYEMNLLSMSECNAMISVIDNNDTGTMFELGYFASIKNDIPEERRIITMTGEGHGLNLMLGLCSDCHVSGVDHLLELLHDLREYTSVDSVFCKHNFNPRVST